MKGLTDKGKEFYEIFKLLIFIMLIIGGGLFLFKFIMGVLL